MGFYSKRFLAALKTRRQWLALALIPAILYMISAAVVDRTLRVTESLSYGGDIRIAKNPIASFTLDELFANPDLLFQEGFVLTDLSRKPELLEDSNFSIDNPMDLRRFIHQSMRLTKSGDSKLEILYQGRHEILGRNLVDYFSDRLMTRAKDASQQTKTSGGSIATTATLEPGAIRIDSSMRAWHPNRLLPTLWTLIVSLLTIMAVIAMREFSDPSFKSERQIARYLGLPVLGTLPDAAPLAKRLNH